MCVSRILNKLFPEGVPPEAPEWVVQSARETAEQEILAAEIHYTYIELIKDGTIPGDTMLGDINHHSYWYKKHLEAAWYCCPEAVAERGLCEPL